MYATRPLQSLLLATLTLAPLVPAAPSNPAHVHIQDFSFNPSPLSIRVGDAVEWDNHDGAPHTATADDGSFDSGTLNQGDSFQHAFTTAGTVPYHCSIHGFEGVLHVEDPAAQPDLVVTALESEDGTPGLSKRLDVSVRNLGLTTADASVVRLSYLSNGAPRTIASVGLPELGPDETVSATIMWNTLGKVGDFVVTATADADGTIAEAREDNNASSIVVSILVEDVDGVEVVLPGA